MGGGLALLQTNDWLRVDLNQRRVDLLVDDEEVARRRAAWKPSIPASQTPWQELYRQLVGQLSTGGCLEPATLHMRVIAREGGCRGIPIEWPCGAWAASMPSNGGSPPCSHLQCSCRHGWVAMVRYLVHCLAGDF